MKHRLERVRELIKRELGDLITREFTFQQLVTIQEVDVTPDFKQAHVYVSVFGGTQKDAHHALSMLHDRRKELQLLLSRRVILKFTPQLHFKLDKAVERGDRIIDILQGLNVPEDEPSEVTEIPPQTNREETEKSGNPGEMSDEQGDDPSDEQNDGK